MSRAYSPCGTTIDVLKSEAKRLKKAEGLTLNAAQDHVAAARGYPAFSRMVDEALVFDRSDPDVIVTRRGAVELIVGIHDLLDFPHQGIIDTAGNAHIAASHKLLFDDGAVTYETNLFAADDVSDAVTIAVNVDALMAAIAAHDEGQDGDLIRLLGAAGVFALPALDQIADCEHEALAALLLRPLGRTVGARCVFNAPLSPLSGMIADVFEIDPDRRAFPNVLDDGSIIVSNGGGTLDTFKMAHLTRAEFDAVLRNMEAFDPGCTKTAWGEGLMHDVLLKDKRTPEEEREIAAPESAPSLG